MMSLPNGRRRGLLQPAAVEHGHWWRQMSPFTQYFGSTTNFLDDNDTSSFQQCRLFKKDWKSRKWGEKNAPTALKMSQRSGPWLKQKFSNLQTSAHNQFTHTLHMILISCLIWGSEQNQIREIVTSRLSLPSSWISPDHRRIKSRNFQPRSKAPGIYVAVQGTPEHLFIHYI